MATGDDRRSGRRPAGRPAVADPRSEREDPRAEREDPDALPEPPSARKGLRTGFTTGACAAAATKAAAIGLTSGTVPDRVTITLPKGPEVAFAVEPVDATTAVVVKDAGDDPDCTDGARLTVHVEWAPAGPTELVAGPGVGTVTKLGLGLPVGGPAINPVPRRMIMAVLHEIAGDAPVRVTVSVPDGEVMARKTTNERLGIVGGISILGTTGIVRPFSTASYRASVVQQVKVAAAQGEQHMVLCTGSRSESAARHEFPDLDVVCVVEVGDYSGIALRTCATSGMGRATVVAMAGKIAKLAAGVMMTHFHRSRVDTELLAEVARLTGAPEAVRQAATATATARHFFEVCVETGSVAPLTRLCELAAAQCRAHTGGVLDVEVLMVDFDGLEVVARG
jgi:cobalt-precorrin-5B (C1)-methyltransferase